MRALLALEDGSVFQGRAVGSTREAGGEVVFNTSMTGYQEILTDPSYFGQIVVFTAPELGNYGIHEGHDESQAPHAVGLIAREVCESPTHPDSQRSLSAWLREHDRFGLADVDTRALTLLLRRKGTLRGWMTTLIAEPGDAVARAREVPPMDQVPAVASVTTRSVYQWHELELAARATPGESLAAPGAPGSPWPSGSPRIVVLDCGVKFNILRELARRGCQVTVLPADAEVAWIERLQPDGVVFSNGPGDPAALSTAVPRIQRLLERYPTLAICLGHQLVSLALGCRIVKLPFGHHGGNHPVKDLRTNRVQITAQNHNYAIDPTSVPRELRVTHINLNDGTIEGIRHESLPLWSLQFHPEASPGPHDAVHAFDDFVLAVRGEQPRRAHQPAALDLQPGA